MAWVIPQNLLDAAPQSPYGWPASLWRAAGRRGPCLRSGDPTLETIGRLAGPGGAVLDIGAGTGRASLPACQGGHPVTAVEPNETMLEGLEAASADLPVTIVEGRWPEARSGRLPIEVAMCAHVVFDVAEVGPFLSAMNEKAPAGVVVEMTERHPWVHLGPYYRALHNSSDRSAPVGRIWWRWCAR